MDALFQRNDWNTLEVMLLPKEPASGLSSHELQVLPVHFDKATWSHILNKVGTVKNVRNPKSFQLREYYHMDIMDQYDTRDDTHRVTQKNYVTDFFEAPKLYAVAFRQDLLPEYRFPNVKELSTVATRTRTSFWHTNRISIHFDETVWGEQPGGEPINTIHIHVTCPEKVDKIELQASLYALIRELLGPLRDQLALSPSSGSYRSPNP